MDGQAPRSASSSLMTQEILISEAPWEIISMLIPAAPRVVNIRPAVPTANFIPSPTMARMARLMASGSVGHASTTRCRSASRGGFPSLLLSLLLWVPSSSSQSTIRVDNRGTNGRIVNSRRLNG